MQVRNSLGGSATIVAALALLATGCTTLGGGSKSAPPPTYDLTVPAVSAGGRAARGQLTIAEATTIGALDSDKIVVRPASGEIAALADAQWSDRLTKLVQARTIQAFENANRTRTVGRASDRITSDYQLLLDIRAFEISISAGPAAEVEISAKIVGDRSGRIIAGRVFHATIPASATQGAGAVAALDAAFGKVVTELVLWATKII